MVDSREADLSLEIFLLEDDGENVASSTSLSIGVPLGIPLEGKSRLLDISLPESRLLLLFIDPWLLAVGRLPLLCVSRLARLSPKADLFVTEASLSSELNLESRFDL